MGDTNKLKFPDFKTGLKRRMFVYTCTQCGEADIWGDGWGYYGNEDEQQAYFCSQYCFEKANKDIAKFLKNAKVIQPRYVDVFIYEDEKDDK